MARLKNGFQVVYDTLVGPDGAWKGLDDYKPFWMTRRIAEERGIGALVDVQLSLHMARPSRNCFSLFSSRQEFNWSVINGRSRSNGPGIDVRAWVLDWQNPVSPQMVTEVGGPDALFMQYRSEFFVQVCARPVPHQARLDMRA